MTAIEKIKAYFDYAEDILKEDWLCDHSVGVCWCSFHDKRKAAHEALAALQVPQGEFTEEARKVVLKMWDEKREKYRNACCEDLTHLLNKACDRLDRLEAENKDLKHGLNVSTIRYDKLWAELEKAKEAANDDAEIIEGYVDRTEVLQAENKELHDRLHEVGVEILKLKQENKKLNLILFHRENGLAHPDLQGEIDKSKLAEENKRLKKLLQAALPNIECKNNSQSGLITEIGEFLEQALTD